MRSVGWLAARGLLAFVAAAVCLAQTPGAASPAATLVSQAGQVSVLRDSQPWALQTGDQIKPQQIIVTGPDGYGLFRLADGSTFEVFQNSRVTFRENPGEWRDLLEVLLGRIRVYIQKLGGQSNPNKVRTPTAIISVRGTKFDVVVEDSGETTLVSVEEGEVAVEHAIHPTARPTMLRAGESLRVYKNVPLARQRIERGTVVRAALRAAAEAIYTAIYRSPRAGGAGVPIPGSGGGTPLPGDNGGTPPPTQAPPNDAGPGAPPPPPPAPKP